MGDDNYKWGALIDGVATHDASDTPLSFMGGKMSIHEGNRFLVANADTEPKGRQSSPAVGKPGGEPSLN
jgi:hypothetical protein